MGVVMDKHNTGVQQEAGTLDHVELKNYKKQKDTKSRWYSYLLNALYNANTSFWSIVGIDSICGSFDLHLLTWPLYLAAGIFTLGNLVYDFVTSFEHHDRHESKEKELEHVFSDNKLEKYQDKANLAGKDVDLVSYAKLNTAHEIVDDVIVDFLITLRDLDNAIASPDISEKQKAELGIIRDKLVLKLRHVKSQIHDKALSHRLDICLRTNKDCTSAHYELPLFVKAYEWISLNFKKFTTGAVTSTGAAIFLISAFGGLATAISFLPWSLIAMTLIAAGGAMGNYFLNEFLFDAADEENNKRKKTKRDLANKRPLIKFQTLMWELQNEATSIFSDASHAFGKHTEPYFIENNLDDILTETAKNSDILSNTSTKTIREIEKIERPSLLRRYALPLAAGAFALYGGYGIAYGLLAPITFLGIQTAAWVLPAIGIVLAGLNASRKIFNTWNDYKSIETKFSKLEKVIPIEQIHLWQHECNLAGIDSNVAEHIYNGSRKVLLDLLCEESDALQKLIKQFESQTPKDSTMAKYHKLKLAELRGLQLGLQQKIIKNTDLIKNKRHQARIINRLNTHETTQRDDTIFDKLKYYARLVLDYFEENWSDFFDGGSTICGIAATTLFLFVSSPALTVVIPVLLGSFLLGGIGTMIFNMFVENSSQYSLTNVKNTKKKLLDKSNTYKMYHETLLAKNQAEQIINSSNTFASVRCALNNIDPVEPSDAKPSIKVSHKTPDDDAASQKDCIRIVNDPNAQESTMRALVDAIIKDIRPPEELPATTCRQETTSRENDLISAELSDIQYTSI